MFNFLFAYLSQQNYTLHMARYIQIDVSFRESIQTNVDCSKISSFVCGNISTNSVAKSIDTFRYPYHSLNLARPRKKFNFLIRFYCYSDSNRKVKFDEELPSPPPCLFFVQRTGQQLFFAPSDDPTPVHSTSTSWKFSRKF